MIPLAFLIFFSYVSFSHSGRGMVLDLDGCPLSLADYLEALKVCQSYLI